MKISDLYKKKKTVVSFEIFPPKKDASVEKVYDAIDKLTHLSPDFISVTYGAGGTVDKANVTADIAERIKSFGIEALSHLTCVGMSTEDVTRAAADFKRRGIENILVLRGDDTEHGAFSYAKDFISALKGNDFCLGAAAYPEGHITQVDLATDISYLKQKQDAGADFFITQLFFDNAVFYRFLERAKKAGIKRPISAGIMPIIAKSQLERMAFLCGASLPAEVFKLINKHGDDGEALLKAGIEYAAKQILELRKEGVDGIHLYTMNKPAIAESIMKDLHGGDV